MTQDFDKLVQACQTLSDLDTLTKAFFPKTSKAGVEREKLVASGLMTVIDEVWSGRFVDLSSRVAKFVREASKHYTSIGSAEEEVFISIFRRGMYER